MAHLQSDHCDVPQCHLTSSSPEARVLPSGENATPQTISIVRRERDWFVPLAKSHSLIAPCCHLPPPMAKVVPSGENAIDVALNRAVRMVPSSLPVATSQRLIAALQVFRVRSPHRITAPICRG